MTTATPAAARRNPFLSWLNDEQRSTPLDRFRIAFALIWLAYDVCDLSVHGTWTCLHPDQLLSGAQSDLVQIQVALIVLELGLLTGFFPFAFAFAAAYVRGVMAFEHFRLNDFLYYCMTAALMGVAYLDARPIFRPKFVQRWALSVMRVELGFLYIATAIMKMNPSWLSGAHLYVRFEYLREAFNWPYPGFVMSCVESPKCAAAHAVMGVSGEVTLGLLLIVGRTPRLALLLAIAIHAFGALGTNVWFFGASMIAHVAWIGSSTRVRGNDQMLRT